MNGRLKALILILTFVLSIAGAYFTTEIRTAEKLADKPSRQELKETVKDSTDGIQRQLDDIKKQADKTYDRVEKIVDKLDSVLQKDRR